MMSSSSSSCSIMLWFVFVLSLHLYSAAASDCISLLQFAHSFTITKDASYYDCDFQYDDSFPHSYPKTRSWNNGTDCCSWDGVICDNVIVGSGRKAVIELDLTCSWLSGSLISNSTLFALGNLRRLNLAGNNFNYSEIPSRFFHVFPDMTHLNLSNSWFTGLIPREIAHLSKLESLDLSHGSLVMEDNVLKSIMRNLTRLRRLALNDIDMSQASSFTNLSLASLNYLSLSGCGLKGFMVSDLFRLPKLHYLYLSGNNFSDNISSSNWTSPLLALDLSNTVLEGRLLEKIATLKTLHYLNLYYNPLTGEIPASIGNLTALEYLDLSWTGIRGSLPSTLANLEQLSYLNLGHNDNMTGVVNFEVFANMRKMLYLDLTGNMITDGGNSSFPELKELTLNGCNLTKFPYFLSSSKGLQSLDLSENMIRGPIPKWLWSLWNDTLEQLSLSDNLITGVLSPFPWKKVTNVYISYNLLEGELQLPPSATIDEYDASHNNFTEIIPSSICQLSQLRYLYLSNNKLFGTIPSCISNLTMLIALDVSSNHLDGPLPRSVSNCTMLNYFIVGHNRINDTFPDWLPNTLTNLDLQSNDFHGPIPIAYTLMFVETYNLADNAFTGHCLANYFLNSSTEALYVLDLSKNNFVGPIPLPPPSVRYYIVSGNNFTGEIPAAICDVTTGLEVINLSNNSLVGSIPHCLAKMSATLFVLNLRNNKLIGEIPQIFGLDNCLLRTVDLSQNNLSGTVPRFLANCKDLEVFDLSNNAIEDVFPSWLAALPKLHVFVIRSNRFYGPVKYDERESTVHPFRQLHIFDISVNQFSGPLPTKYMAKFEAMMDYSEVGILYADSGWYTYEDSVMVVMKGNEFELMRIWKVFTTIDLSDNFFEGEFPGLVGNLKALQGLNFSHNHLTGNISPSVRNLSNLEWLDLSSNNLSGEIPPGMADLTFLEILNLSRNRLSGPIPTGPQFSTFGSDAFEGNPQLCGFPLPKECGSEDDQDSPPPPNDVEEDEGEDLWMEWTTVPVGYIFGIVFGFTIGYIFW